MALRAASRRAQRGAALLVMVAIVMMGVAYTLASRLNAASRFIGVDRESNAKVLNRAKQALIGWVAVNAAQTDNNPGRLPCPEAVNSIGTDSEGISAPLISPSTPNCATVGRLPWRTLGLDKLVDANTEPLWYVVSPGWALQNSSTLLTINSDSRGSLVVDGQPAPNDVVALIIAPGQAMNVAATGSCTARAQARSAPAPSMDPRDYIECFNSATPAFSTVGPATSFNDQVLKLTTADLLPAIEAAIAHRIEREIAPALRGVYASSAWGPTISSSNPVFPYPALFADPGASPYQGAAGLTAGLLPFNQTQGCNPATDPRCTTTLTAWSSGTVPVAYKNGGYGYIQTQTCSWQSGGDMAQCLGEYHEDDTSAATLAGAGMRIEMSATIRNVAMGLRLRDTTKATVEARDNADPMDPWLPQATTVSTTMNSNGSVTITFAATLPNINDAGWNVYALYRIRLERSVIGDHALLDPTNGTTGWFVRNEWYRLLYYATVAGHTAAALPATPSCTTGGSCLSVANGDPTRPIAPVGGQRAILIFAGSSVVGQTRPSATRGDYFEFGNATGAFERQPVKKSPVFNAALKVPFNDRIIVVGSN